ncbi:rod shape-determining protein MreC [Candidatus Gottesmanbacteria bacterium CG11_big_fil_rev_8_21_14_0_20_37_11]|uniref:Cell shape-determining protein MreC n=3 Tax=Candidatus Gottesmaniibacteriota TaxID=1752720 RepID=A0A2M7RRS3_9BACT|nr:MAG: rod shape-determining protein MreC [Candidatus Gottesmanbacteria bacterium CG1_02_37_22]PIP32943.1 MAG: rod shape-determining protein MreC [Candidatus Gottesmanbacteria bacterium CG23_combo_of_CG06-09_8_20_14_all_37_19]PIR08645.1 MAG: rod shape-determining protein MreC [Candidatus Gottesmanbacteria bacterium CG11_big_fil_rev_8_21_14_0_20_37_11]PIZ03018.1 MAG: rod shape-determining protein MreC [Candidatus Gottesmanbacteria bacterium CG_4_10_14_0_8_um_filter_37_24]
MTRSIIWISISLVLLVLDFFGLLGGLKIYTSRITFPVKKNIYSTSLAFRDFGRILIDYPKLKKNADDTEWLKKQNDELNYRLKLINEENIKLRQQLESPLPATYKFIPSHVYAVSRYMDIGVGEKNGIKKGMAVIDGSSLIGKVLSVEENTSQIILLTDVDTNVAAKTSRGVRGIISGQYGENIVLDKVLQKDPLFIEDQVTTSGEDGLPPNLLIGNIVYINSDDVSVYKKAKINPALDYNKEEIVFVVSSIQ